MITFEEYQFKVKHGSIGNHDTFLGEGTRLADLEVGDWFYFISDRAYEHCQIMRKEIDHDGDISFHYKQRNKMHCWTLELYNVFEDDYCTCHPGDNSYCLTTIPEVAEKWHQYLCPNRKLEKYPAK